MTDDRPALLRIVCTYPDAALPSAWFQAVQRARRAARRAGWLVRIDLLPVRSAPADADVVVARPVELDGLLDRLAAEGRLQRGPEPPRTIAVHRGFAALGDRARVAE